MFLAFQRICIPILKYMLCEAKKKRKEVYVMLLDVSRRKHWNCSWSKTWHPFSFLHDLAFFFTLSLNFGAVIPMYLMSLPLKFVLPLKTFLLHWGNVPVNCSSSIPYGFNWPSGVQHNRASVLWSQILRNLVPPQFPMTLQICPSVEKNYKTYSMPLAFN